MTEARFPLLAQKDMSAAQQELYKRRMVGPWADLRGPFNAFMRNPAMADKALELGNHIRHGNSLPDALVVLHAEADKGWLDSALVIQFASFLAMAGGSVPLGNRGRIAPRKSRKRVQTELSGLSLRG